MIYFLQLDHDEHSSVTCMIVMLKEVLYQISQSLEDSFLFNLAPVEDTVDSTDMGVVVVVDFNEGGGAVFTVSSLHYLEALPLILYQRAVAL